MPKQFRGGQCMLTRELLKRSPPRQYRPRRRVGQEGPCQTPQVSRSDDQSLQGCLAVRFLHAKQGIPVSENGLRSSSVIPRSKRLSRRSASVGIRTTSRNTFDRLLKVCSARCAGLPGLSGSDSYSSSADYGYQSRPDGAMRVEVNFSDPVARGPAGPPQGADAGGGAGAGGRSTATRSRTRTASGG